MSWHQIVFGVALVVVLLVLAVFYAWRQILLLRRVPNSGSDESRFQRSLAVRRLVNSGLMVVLALLLAGALVFLEQPAQDLADQQDARELAGKDTKLAGAEKEFARAYSIYWIAFLLVFLAVVVLAGADLVAIRRYAVEQFRKLREDRRAMIERETARLREERSNRHNGPPDVSLN